MSAFSGVANAYGRMAAKTDNDSTKKRVHGMLWHRPVTEAPARILPKGDVQVCQNSKVWKQSTFQLKWVLFMSRYVLSIKPMAEVRSLACAHARFLSDHALLSAPTRKTIIGLKQVRAA